MLSFPVEHPPHVFLLLSATSLLLFHLAQSCSSSSSSSSSSSFVSASLCSCSVSASLCSCCCPHLVLRLGPHHDTAAHKVVGEAHQEGLRRAGGRVGGWVFRAK
jgi:hypothetical protein